MMAGIARAPTDLRALGRWLQVLAGPDRLLIFHLLMEGVHCNCELGEALGLPPNLVSPYLRALRNAGLVDAEQDPLDARLVYYSINRNALDELLQAFEAVFDAERIKPRRLNCGPHAEPVPALEFTFLER
jgi:ArsR family transcriptional regulator, arsenate/arsenite/antimonite-responsive transcriptional repressor